MGKMGNSGDRNSGNRNSGYYNSGHCNRGNWNSGFFNTDEPTVRMFNKDTGLLRSEINIPYLDLQLTQWVNSSKMTEQQKKDNPGHVTTGGVLVAVSYKEAWVTLWHHLDSN